jgi:tRNA (guanine-N7-)-methyltransferase
MKEFPYEFHEKKGFLFYPRPVEQLECDFLEIGPGRGDFLMDLAEQYPDKRVAAIELSKKRHFKLARRIEKRNLTNIQLIQGHAQIALPRLCPDSECERIYVLFPDPWPKDRHAPHRLLNDDFLTLIARRLRDDGQFFFATDFQPYAAWVAANLSRIPVLRNTGDPFTAQKKISDYFPSFYEQKWREEGRQIFYIRCERA